MHRRNRSGSLNIKQRLFLSDPGQTIFIIFRLLSIFVSLSVSIVIAFSLAYTYQAGSLRHHHYD